MISEQWKEMGWQGPNPSTDFRYNPSQHFNVHSYYHTLINGDTQVDVWCLRLMRKILLTWTLDLSSPSKI